MGLNGTGLIAEQRVTASRPKAPRRQDFQIP
jgi:hypothetical protein